MSNFKLDLMSFSLPQDLYQEIRILREPPTFSETNRNINKFRY